MPTYLLHDIVRHVLRAHGVDDAWTFEDAAPWCRVRPRTGTDRVQGWKLHVSATRLSMPEVLHEAAEILVGAGAGFKFARTLDTVDELTSNQAPRAQCGKVVTVYPRDDDQLRELAGRLDRATAGLPGPQILSDRPYRPGSLVHYRYGAFGGVPVLSNDGSFEARLRAPDDSLVQDHRVPWFAPPPWAVLPFEGTPGREAKRPAVPAPVLLADRFEVRAALHHTARGGVYRAVDRKTGRDVVVKQARAHVGGHRSGEDARTRLRLEARNLIRLAGVCPEYVHEFEREGHCFLVEEFVEGEPLAAWVRSRAAENAHGQGVAPEEAVRVAGELARLVAAVHERGLVYQDLSPNNVIVTPEGRLVLIDPEWAAEPGEWTVHVMTPGFVAPEQAAERFAPALGRETDLYALGAVLFHVCAGTVPAFGDGRLPKEAPHGRVRRLLDLFAAESPAARLLAPAILGLTRDDPADRWSLTRLQEFLASAPPDTAEEPRRRETPGPKRWKVLVDDGLTHLVTTMADPQSPAGRLWPSGPFGDLTDPCALQHGSAGVLAALVHADRLGHGTARLRETIEQVAHWTGDRVRDAVPAHPVLTADAASAGRRTLPGLYFGRTGTAWALLDAAEHLGDPDLAALAGDLARTAPVRWPNPDVCHGAAGAGLAQLHFWRRTGRAEFLERAADCADGLAAAVEHTDDRVVWPVPEDFDSGLCGLRHLGFAHGVAGVGAFLLSVGQATGRQEFLDLAVAAGQTLLAEAERGAWGARWRADLADGPGAGLLHHWCSGSSGVGTFLVRLGTATGDGTCLRTAEEAARDVYRARWTAPAAACHGLAGDGEFLLDLAAAVPEGPYRAWAEDLADVLDARALVLDGLRLVPDESGESVRADHQTGLAGTVRFLLRLTHGGPRPWLPDPAARP